MLQIESEVGRSGLVVAGMYHAHDNIRDNHVDIFSQKIADKVSHCIHSLMIVIIIMSRLVTMCQAQCW